MDTTDTEACYRAVKSRDRRFDGVFYVAVRTTGIYCRPSCPARTPAPQNVAFHRTAAAAQQAGYRACRRCLPDATPGSPDWDVAADVAGRAMRLINDGWVERAGVEGLADRVGYSSRHLGRVLTAELGAGPLALARARRAQTARILIDTTALPFAEIAFAAGFASVRQFNETLREVYAATPTQLRGVHRRPPGSGRLDLRIPVRRPYAGGALLAFLADRAVAGVEAVDEGGYTRSLRLPRSWGVVRLSFDDVGSTGQVRCTLELGDLRDLAAALERCRRLLDADCDPVAVDDALGADPSLARPVRARPGLRVPGHVDGAELAVRAVLGQQVTVRAATTAASGLATSYGEPLPAPVGWAPGITRLFPASATLADVPPGSLRMPGTRARALTGLCAALAGGDVVLDRGADRRATRDALLTVPGIGPWTADYIALRALGDPDVFLPGDVGVRHALGLAPREAAARSEAWRPWRSYALLHLWTSLADGPPRPAPDERKYR